MSKETARNRAVKAVRTAGTPSEEALEVAISAAENSGGARPPTPTKKRPGTLATLEQVRKEMARVYRDARTGQLGTSDASRLSFILQALGRLIEGLEMERRLETLENRLQAANETKREREWSGA